MPMMDCLFCNIIKKNIKAEVIYEDDYVLAFNDIVPQAPKHFLVIPKKHIDTLNDVEDSAIIGKLVCVATKIAKEQGFADDGFRVVMNCNAHGGQTVYHVHLHCLGARQLNWPPG